MACFCICDVSLKEHYRKYFILMLRYMSCDTWWEAAECSTSVCISSQCSTTGLWGMMTPYCSCFLSQETGHQVRQIRLSVIWQNLTSERNRFLTVYHFLTHHSSFSHCSLKLLLLLDWALKSLIDTHTPDLLYIIVLLNLQTSNFKGNLCCLGKITGNRKVTLTDCSVT